MARSTQKDPERQLAPEEESTVHDQAEMVQPENSPFGRVISRAGDSQHRARWPSQRVLGGAPTGHAALAAPGAETHAAALFETVTSGRSALHLEWLRIYTVKSAPRGIASRCCVRLRPPGSRRGHESHGTNARGGHRHCRLAASVSRPGRGRKRLGRIDRHRDAPGRGTNRVRGERGTNHPGRSRQSPAATPSGCAGGRTGACRDPAQWGRQSQPVFPARLQPRPCHGLRHLR